MISFTLNGEPQELDVDSNTPLLWVVRDHLKYTGSKFGCGQGLCGACTMHLNGQPIRACITPIKSVANQNITTIEGISKDGGLHPVQEAWVKNGVPQCGYCQSGQIMSAVALLEDNPNPSENDIHQAMSGNLCRCGTYPKIKQAIKDAAHSLATNAGQTSAETISTT